MNVFPGVDQSLEGTGIAVLNETDNAPLYLHRIEPKGTRAEQRLALIYDDVVQVLSSAAWYPMHAAVEGFSIRSVNRPFDLGEVAGVIKLALHQAGCPITVVPPTCLKKFITGRGDADKEAMYSATAERFGVGIPQNDMCDAYGLARIARAMALGLAGLTRAEEEVLTGLRKPAALVSSMRAAKTKRSL